MRIERRLITRAANRYKPIREIRFGNPLYAVVRILVTHLKDVPSTNIERINESGQAFAYSLFFIR